jgi:hypothetical protein
MAQHRKLNPYYALGIPVRCYTPVMVRDAYTHALHRVEDDIWRAIRHHLNPTAAIAAISEINEAYHILAPIVQQPPHKQAAANIRWHGQPRTFLAAVGPSYVGVYARADAVPELHFQLDSPITRKPRNTMCLASL